MNYQTAKMLTMIPEQRKRLQDQRRAESGGGGNQWGGLAAKAGGMLLGGSMLAPVMEPALKAAFTGEDTSGEVEAGLKSLPGQALRTGGRIVGTAAGGPAGAIAGATIGDSLGGMADGLMNDGKLTDAELAGSASAGLGSGINAGMGQLLSGQQQQPLTPEQAALPQEQDPMGLWKLWGGGYR